MATFTVPERVELNVAARASAAAMAGQRGRCAGQGGHCDEQPTVSRPAWGGRYCGPCDPAPALRQPDPNRTLRALRERTQSREESA